MGKFSIFAWNSLLAAVLGLFTYGSFKGMVGVFVLFVGLGITALLGFIPFIGPFLYLVLALFVVTPWVYSTIGFASSWLTLTIITVHGIIAIVLTLRMLF